MAFQADGKREGEVLELVPVDHVVSEMRVWDLDTHPKIVKTEFRNHRYARSIRSSRLPCEMH